LRRPFIQNKREIISNSVKEIIITLGGSDLHNLTPLILKRFSKKYTDIIINVVIGPSFQNIEEIKKYNFENVIFHEDVTAEEMKNIMLKSDIAITAAGQTIYELMATKTPFIPIKVVENQSLNIEGLKKLNLIGVEIEYNSLLLNEKIVKEFERMRKFDIRKELSNEYEKIIDGLGSKRIIDALIQEDTVSNYLLRKVRKEDIRGTFQLSNEDYVRKYSLNKEKISWNTHVNWFNRMLNSDNDVFYVVTDCSNKFLGQIRYKVENKTAIVSISLSKSIMNKGLSKGFLKQSLDLLTSERNYLDNIVAFVSDKNIASKRLFEKIHFVLDENQNGLLKYIYSINKVENNKC
jgi:RimJ/RimL family protein N-acetyltransferase